MIFVVVVVVVVAICLLHRELSNTRKRAGR